MLQGDILHHYFPQQGELHSTFRKIDLNTKFQGELGLETWLERFFCIV